MGSYELPVSVAVEDSSVTLPFHMRLYKLDASLTPHQYPRFWREQLKSRLSRHAKMLSLL